MASTTVLSSRARLPSYIVTICAVPPPRIYTCSESDASARGWNGLRAVLLPSRFWTDLNDQLTECTEIIRVYWTLNLRPKIDRGFPVSTGRDAKGARITHASASPECPPSWPRKRRSTSSLSYRGDMSMGPAGLCSSSSELCLVVGGGIFHCEAHRYSTCPTLMAEAKPCLLGVKTHGLGYGGYFAPEPCPWLSPRSLRRDRFTKRGGSATVPLTIARNECTMRARDRDRH